MNLDIPIAVVLLADFECFDLSEQAKTFAKKITDEHSGGLPTNEFVYASVNANASFDEKFACWEWLPRIIMSSPEWNRVPRHVTFVPAHAALTDGLHIMADPTFIGKQLLN